MGRPKEAPPAVAEIHDLAVVDPRARLGHAVRVGPFAVIGPDVEIGDRSIVHSHAVLDGHTILGEEVEIFPHAAVGLKPQDKKYDGSPTRLEIGARTVVREGATIQPGSVGASGGLTVVGSDCLIMAYVHIAHDCTVGDGVIIANASQVAGHCTIEDHAILGGVTTVHQFVRIGTRAITGASARVIQDIAPYCMADGHPARLIGLNRIGLERAGYSETSRRALKDAYRRLFVRGPYREALEHIEITSAPECAEVAHLCRFLRASTRGVARPRRSR